jgi:hypothetical protein
MSKNDLERLDQKSRELAIIIGKFAKALPKHIIIVLEPEDDLALAIKDDKIINTRILSEKGERVNIVKNILSTDKESKTRGKALSQAVNFLRAVLMALSVKKNKLKKLDKQAEAEISAEE